ncbi:MAG: hypothetical protein ACREXS_18945, partial [Gammaproteobacteria bacterium]
NIDEVIFFPLMKPVVSPVNASIYGIQEPELAPIDDLALSFEDFETLCDTGILKPQERHLTLKPHVRLWTFRLPRDRSHASGHVEIEGFLPNSVLRLAGYTIKFEGPLSKDEEERKVLDLLELSLVEFLRKRFPQCRVTVSPATVLRYP